MTKSIMMAAGFALCAISTAATADNVVVEQPAPAYVNDMPFPAEMPVYTPRVIFADLPFMEMPSTVVFADMPFPTEMKTYTPTRYYADMPTRSDALADLSDQAMLQLDN